ncbi:hypothetical protein M8C21_024600 [Ambrosia artemisiifolia]|uniref:Uncharacterized protein n=1 Tax=Ambrosia artemisiifolia TaxID=4212 RepID=A0AAD5C4U1_AMBAR|nr:hypothetical protein M8C21_024600 [Ambrosia artemisiifolia]
MVDHYKLNPRVHKTAMLVQKKI